MLDLLGIILYTCVFVFCINTCTAWVIVNWAFRCQPFRALLWVWLLFWVPSLARCITHCVKYRAFCFIINFGKGFFIQHRLITLIALMGKPFSNKWKKYKSCCLPCYVDILSLSEKDNNEVFEWVREWYHLWLLCTFLVGLCKLLWFLRIEIKL